jgi:hypothetical protein
MASKKIQIAVTHQCISDFAKPNAYKAIDMSIRLIINDAEGKSELYNDITSSARYTRLIKEVNKFYNYAANKYELHINKIEKEQN